MATKWNALKHKSSPEVRANLKREAHAELEAWSAEAKRSQSPAQAAAAAKLTDEEVNRMVHE